MQSLVCSEWIGAHPATQLARLETKENLIWKLSSPFSSQVNSLPSHQNFSGGVRGIEAPCLTDVLWHGLSSADARTAEGFDSVRFRYPVPSGVDQNRHPSRRRQASSTSVCRQRQNVGTAAGCSLLIQQWPVTSC